MTGDSSPVIRVAVAHFPPTAVAVPAVRTSTVRTLTEWSVDPDAVSSAELVVCELASNAVKASRLENVENVVAMRLTATSRNVLVEVWDGNDTAPRIKSLDVFSEDGRGLLMVDALCSQWSWLPGQDRRKSHVGGDSRRVAARAADDGRRGLGRSLWHRSSTAPTRRPCGVSLTSSSGVIGFVPARLSATRTAGRLRPTDPICTLHLVRPYCRISCPSAHRPTCPSVHRTTRKDGWVDNVAPRGASATTGPPGSRSTPAPAPAIPPACRKAWPAAFSPSGHARPGWSGP
ncbi:MULTISPECIES: ATP-binding protein [unclassified Frankia]